jgi:glucose/arabinose dehydrogenase
MGAAMALTVACSSSVHAGPASTPITTRSTPITTTSTPVTTMSTAPQVVLDRPDALSVDGRGDLLIANQGTNQILRWVAGRLSPVAGNGTAGFAGDGGPAARAELSMPSGMAVAEDGTMYLADTGNNRIRALTTSLAITTVAGNGLRGTSTGPAIAVLVSQPLAVAIHGQDLYVVDDAGVQLLSSGKLSTVVAAGPRALTIDGTPMAFFPDAIAVDPTGDLYVANFSPKALVEFSPSGHVLKHWDTYVARSGLATASDGSIVVADYGGFSLDQITGANLVPVVAFTFGSIKGVGGTFRPSGVAVAADGTLFAVTDGVNGGTDRASLITAGARGQVTLLSASAPWCRTSQLGLTLGDPISEPTGEQSLSLVLTDVSANPCALLGYPTVTLTDAAGEALPFTYTSRDQVVTDQVATTVTLAPAATAYVTINKYRCDLRDLDVAARVTLAAPDDAPSPSLRVDIAPHDFGYCGPGDPGSTVDVSPVEPSVSETLRH